ncbi:hypothetical protein C9374_003872 [Naegleria lovaniensis]|uniref:Peptidase S8/S53 domain-containing protein n=1 Tax=Naegleria lovaniensis TaxID=51637 RepID=A0AA88H419_NAELO|nr:uncharacterized protein C9374_003872 [Naegleria lovaniensis]KAG2394108.1 hypothetical protein C9374_003872 [Naegleria lovaniensis]
MVSPHNNKPSSAIISSFPETIIYSSPSSKPPFHHTLPMQVLTQPNINHSSRDLNSSSKTHHPCSYYVPSFPSLPKEFLQWMNSLNRPDFGKHRITPQRSSQTTIYLSKIVLCFWLTLFVLLIYSIFNNFHLSSSTQQECHHGFVLGQTSQCSVRKFYKRFFNSSQAKHLPTNLTCKVYKRNVTQPNENQSEGHPKYIVMFHEYMNATRHEEYIRILLDGVRSGYKVIHRDNAATRFFDTDFALVEFENITLKEKLENKTKFVKYIVKQHEYHNMINNERKLLSTHHDEIESIHEDEEESSSLLNTIGKLFTHWTTEDAYAEHHHKRKLCNHPNRHYTDVTDKLNAHVLWEKGILGQNVRVAVFDTGLSTKRSESFSHIEDMINYTTEDSVNDELGHGTFISGVIGAKHSQSSKAIPQNVNTTNIPDTTTTGAKNPSQSGCQGLAPEASLFVFKVFTSKQVSYTSWFLDAFNYAMKSGIQILNLSIGGPDYLDIPFIDKVRELTANGIIIISAIGNDGPLYGTLNNPADLANVIGVGGIDDNDNIAKFSSRGVTTYELRFKNGYGRVKPDIVTMSFKLRGLGLNHVGTFGSCHSILSGTSVASPVVAGAVTLLASSALADNKLELPSNTDSNDLTIRANLDKFSLPKNSLLPLINPASIKQILIESAQPVHHANIFEQGAGKLNLEKAYELLQDYLQKGKPKATFYPNELDLTACPYMWPFCSQPLYHTAMPLVFNVTILNAMSASGRVMGDPVFVPGRYGEFLDVTFTYPKVMWPYSGWLGVHISVRSSARFFNGYCEGTIKMKIMSPPLGIGKDGDEMQISEMELKVKVKVIQPPLRQQRILWDQYHNLQYPPGYVPRDNLANKDEILDWNGDHIHTNFRDMYIYLRNKGYYVEILTNDLTEFDASKYGTLMIVDPEEEFTETEREKLKDDVQLHGLSVVVFADWYSVPIMKHIKFFDDNTNTVWTPITGGSNLPALNALLDPFNIVFGTRVYEGEITVGKEKATYASGASIIKFPEEGMLASFQLKDQGIEILSGNKQNGRKHLLSDLSGGNSIHKVPVLGFTQSGKGRLAVFGDSNCLDSAGNPHYNCFWLLDQMLQFTSQNKMSEEFKKDANLKTLSHLFVSQSSALPERMTGNELHLYSKVPLEQYIDARPINGSNTYIGRRVRNSNYDEESQMIIDEDQDTSPFIANLHLRVILPIFFMIVCLVFLIYLSVSRRKTMNSVVFNDKRHTV